MLWDEQPCALLPALQPCGGTELGFRCCWTPPPPGTDPLAGARGGLSHTHTLQMLWLRVCRRTDPKAATQHAVMGEWIQLGWEHPSQGMS